MKVFIAASWLKLGGGVTRTLFELLKHIDYSKYDVTLMVMDLDKSVLQYVPDEVKVVSTGGCFQSCSAASIIKEKLKHGRLLFVLSYLSDLLLFRLTGDNYRHQGWITRHMEKQQESYDVAISYAMMNSIVNKYVIDNVKAGKKIMWCHTDISLYKDNYTAGLERLYLQYDRINCVSGYCLRTLAEKYPRLKGKLAVAYNFIDRDAITEAASAAPDVDIPAGKTVLCTVSRISREKGTDILVDAAGMLRDSGFDFVWWVIGAEFDEEFSRRIKEKISDRGLSGTVLLLGEKNPPYAFMNACDIYVQPSRFEGFCTTTNEAKVLFKPVVTTRVSGADEQFTDGVNGLITEISAQAVYEAVSELMVSESKRIKFSDELKKSSRICQENSFESMIL